MNIVVKLISGPQKIMDGRFISKRGTNCYSYFYKLINNKIFFSNFEISFVILCTFFKNLDYTYNLYHI